MWNRRVNYSHSIILYSYRFFASYVLISAGLKLSCPLYMRNCVIHTSIIIEKIVRKSLLRCISSNEWKSSSCSQNHQNISINWIKMSWFLQFLELSIVFIKWIQLETKLSSTTHCFQWENPFCCKFTQWSCSCKSIRCEVWLVISQQCLVTVKIRNPKYELTWITTIWSFPSFGMVTCTYAKCSILCSVVHYLLFVCLFTFCVLAK